MRNQYHRTAKALLAALFLSLSATAAPDPERLIEEARRLTEQDDFAAAALRYELALASANIDKPAFKHALYGLQSTCDKAWMGSTFADGARRALRRVEESNLSPINRNNLKADVLTALARHHTEYHQYFAAIPCYETLLAITPKHTHAGLHRKLATCYTQAGHLRKAVTVWEQLLNANPDDAAARLELAGLHFRLGEVEEGLAVARADNDPIRIFRIARDLMRNRHLDRAEQLTRTILAEHPQAPSLLGKVLFEQRKLDEALVQFRKAYTEASGDWQHADIARKLAEVHAALGELPAAIQQRETELKQAMAKNDEAQAAGLLVLLTEFKRLTGNNIGAVRALIKWRELTPNNPRSLFALRRTAPRAVHQLLLAEKHDDARQLVDELKQHAAGTAWLDCIRAAVLMATGDEQQARSILQRLKKEANTEEARLNRLSNALIACGLDDEAVEICRLVLQTPPHNTVYDSNAHAVLGGWFSHRKQWADAVKHFSAVHAGMGSGLHMVGEKYFRDAEMNARFQAAGKDTDVLVNLLDDPDPLRRRAAIDLLGTYGAAEHIPLLDTRIKNSPPGFRAALHEAATNIRTRMAEAPVEKDIADELRTSKKLTGLGELEWVKRDPLRNDCRWVLPKTGFVAILNTRNDTLTEFPDVLEVLDLKGAETRSISFTQRSVWLGTSRGLLLFDRNTREWSAFAVDNRHLGHPVTRISPEEDRILVTLDLPLGPATYSLNLTTRKWTRL